MYMASTAQVHDEFTNKQGFMLVPAELGILSEWQILQICLVACRLCGGLGLMLAK